MIYLNNISHLNSKGVHGDTTYEIVQFQKTCKTIKSSKNATQSYFKSDEYLILTFRFLNVHVLNALCGVGGVLSSVWA